MGNPKTESTLDIQTLADAISAGILATQPKRDKTFAEIEENSPFNPTGKKNRRLKRQMEVNGHPINEHLHTVYDEEIVMLDKIQPGLYINGKVQVVAKGDAIHILYTNKTVDQRSENKSDWRSFKHMLELICDEMDAAKK
jgi:hypothetical protein